MAWPERSVGPFGSSSGRKSKAWGPLLPQTVDGRCSMKHGVTVCLLGAVGRVGISSMEYTFIITNLDESDEHRHFGVKRVKQLRPSESF